MDSTEKVLENVIQLCKEQREKLGLTNKQIAEKSGLTEAYVANFINGEDNDPFISDMWAIARALGFSFTLTIE